MHDSLKRVVPATLRVLAIGVAAAAFAPAHAATLTWGTSGTGGTGTWSTGSNAWWNGATMQAWNNAANDDAWFTGTPGTVTLTTSNTANSLTFNSYTGLYTLNLNGQTLAIGGGGITMNATSGSATISGAGTVLLTSTQTWTNNSTTGLLTVSSAVNNNGRLLTVAGSGSTTLSGVVSGTGGLTKSGSGLLTLSSANTYTGATTVNGGTLALTGGWSGTMGTIFVSNTAAISIQSGSYALGASTFYVGSATFGTVNQTGGIVTFTTGGGQLLIGNGGSAGSYTLAGGTLTLAGPAASRGIILGVNAGSTGTFAMSGGALNMTAATGGGGDSTLQVGRYDGDTNTSGVFSQTGGVASIGDLSIGGTSTTGTGGTQVMSLTGGTFTANAFPRLSAGNSNVATITIGGSADVTLPAFPTARGTGATATLYFNGGTLRPAAASTAYMGGLTNAYVQSGGATIDVASGRDITISQSLLADGTSPGGGLTKLGSGTLTLSGSNTYTGTTQLSAGTLVINNASALGSGRLAISGGTLDTTGVSTGIGTVSLVNATATPQTWNGDFSFAGSNPANLGNGTVTLTGNRSVTVSKNTFAVGGVAGGFTLEKTGTGTLVLQGAGSQAGTTVTAGTLRAEAPTALGTGAVSVASGAVLDLGSLNQSAAGLSGAGSIVGWTPGVTTPLDGASLINASKTYTQKLDFGSGSGATVNGVAFDNAGTSGAGFSLTGATTQYPESGSPTGYAQLMSDFYYGGNPGTLTFTGLTAGTAYEAVLYTQVGAWANRVQNATFTNGANVQTVNGIDEGAVGAVVYGFVASGTSASISMAPTNAGTTFHWFAASLQQVGAQTLTVGDAGNYTFSGGISGRTGLTKVGAGTQTLSGANTYTGATTVSAGVLLLNSGSAIAGGIGSTGGQSALVINGGVLGLGAGNFSRGLGTGTNQVDLTNGGGFAAYGGSTRTVNLGGAGAAVTWNAGNFVASGSTFVLGAAGATDTVDFQNPVALGGAGTDRTIRVDDGSASVDATLSGVLSGAANLVKTGAGTLRLSAANTYTGTTSVNAGTLLVTGGTLASAAVSVAGGATLSGTATLNATTVANGGILAPGVSGVGTLTLSSLAFGGSGTVNMGIQSGTVSSLLNVNGNVTAVDSGSSVIFAFGPTLSTLTNGTYTLMSYVGTAPDVSTFGWSGTKASRQTLSLTSSSGAVSLVNSNASLMIWAGSAGNGWSAANNWVLSADGSPATFQSLDSVVFNDTATTGTVTLSANVNPVSMTFSGTTLDYTLSTANGSGITNGFLLKSGPAALTISTSNSFSGGTILSAGTLRVGNDAALGTGTVAFNGGTLSSDSATARSLSNAITVGGSVTLGDTTNSGNLTLSGAVDLGGGVRQFTVASAVTLSGTVSNGGLTKSGNGTLTLSASNTYTGATSITQGTLALSGAGALATTGTVSVASGAVFGISGATGNRTLGMLTGVAGSTVALGANSLTIGDATSGTFAGSIAGSGGLTKAGAGTLTLSAASTYTGTTGVNAGVLALGASGALGGNGNISFGGGTLQYSAANTADYSSRIAGSGGAIAIDTNGQNVTFASALASTNLGGLTKAGAGTLTLSAANTYTGTTGVNAGTLAFGNVAALGTGVVTLGNATLQSAVSGTLANAFTLTGSGTFDSQSNANTLSGVMGGSGGLTKAGAGTLTLSAANSYAGTTNVSAGVLQVGSGGTTGSIVAGSPVSVSAGAALAFNRSDALTYGGTVSGAGGLAKLGSGTLALTGSNSYTGPTTINTGVLQIGVSGTGTALTIANASFETPTVSGYQYAPSGAGWTFNGGGIASSTFFTTAPPAGTQAGFIQGTGSFYQSITTATAGFYQITFQAQGRGSTYGPDGVIVQMDGVTSGSWAATDVSQTQWLTYSSLVYLSSGSHTLTFLGNNTAGGDKSSSIDNVKAFQSTTAGSLPSTTAVSLAGSGAAFDLNGTAQTIGSLSGVAGSSVTTGFLTAGGDGTSTTFAGSMSTATLTKVGSGTLTLSGSNSFLASAPAAVAINAGVLALGNSGALGSSGTISFGGGTLQFSGSNTADYSSRFSTAAGQAYSLDTNGQNVSLGTALTSSGGSLTKLGSGTLTLSATNTYTGTTSIAAGTLQVGNGGTTGSLTDSSPVSVSSGAALAFNRSDALTYGGTVSGAGGLTKAGNNTLTLTSGQTYTGATAITGGTLQIGNGGASGSLADSSPVSVSAGAALAFNRSANLTYGGTVSGAGSLTKLGGNTLALAAAQAYTGTTTITGGVLQLGVADALANTSSVLVNGGGFNLGGFNDTVGAVTLTSGSIFGSGKLTAPTYALAGGTVAANLGAGTLTVTGNSLLTATSEATAVNINAGTLQIGNGGTSGALSGTPNVTVAGGAGLAFNRSDALTFGGTISGGGGLTKAGVGTLLLTASNAYTGATTIAGGTIQVGAAGALGTGNLAVNAGGLDLMGKDVLVGMLSGSAGSGITSSVGGSASLTVNMSQSAVFGGVISDGAGTVSLKKAGTETLTLTAAQTYTGNTIISGGVLALGSGASLASTFIKAGETLVGGGTLDVTALSGGLVLASGQTLGGNGYVSGDVVVANGSVLSPGGSVGYLTSNGNMTWQGGGSFLFQIYNANGTTSGTDWDFIDGIATLDITSSPANRFVIDLESLSDPSANVPGAMPELNWDNSVSQKWVFLVAANEITSFSEDKFIVNATNWMNANGNFTIARGDTVGGSNTELYIVYSAVPEPSTLALAGLGLAGLAWRLRRRRKPAR